MNLAEARGYLMLARGFYASFPSARTRQVIRFWERIVARKQEEQQILAYQIRYATS
jgi:hypothetical protein